MVKPQCEICGQLAQGTHFGAISCRACAAFFRRSANSKWSKIECPRGNCKGKLYQCKTCRLKKCRAVGMDSSKFQHNRDPILIFRNQKIPPAFEEFVGRPYMVLLCDSLPTTSKTFVDVSILIKNAQEIMKNGCETPLTANSHLQKLGHALKFGGRLKFVEKTTRVEAFCLWQYYILTTAKWLTYFPPFQELEDDLKTQLLLSIWHVWSRLHKLIATALYRTRYRDAKRTEIVVGDGMLTDCSTLSAETAWLSRYSTEQVCYFLDGLRGGDLYPIIDFLEDCEFTETETTFMLAQLCFQYASTKFGGKIAEKIDEFQEILSNDLHNYYVEVKNLPRYSERLLKMLKVNNEIQENIRKHRDRGEIAKVFGIFDLDFSHPEMFHDTEGVQLLKRSRRLLPEAGAKLKAQRSSSDFSVELLK